MLATPHGSKLNKKLFLPTTLIPKLLKKRFQLDFPERVCFSCFSLFEIKKVGTDKRLTLLVMNNKAEFESSSILEIQSDFSIGFSQE